MLRVIYAWYLVCVVCMDGHGGIMYCGNFVFYLYARALVLFVKACCQYGFVDV